MKHWRRFIGTAVALITAALWFSFYQPEAVDDQKQRLSDFSSLLSGVSRNWQLSDLESLMLPSMRDDSRYEPVLTLAQKLGRFVGCERLQLGEFAEDAMGQAPLDRLDTDVVYQGNGECAFENGKAYVLLGYVKPQGQPQLVLLVVDHIELFDRPG